MQKAQVFLMGTTWTGPPDLSSERSYLLIIMPWMHDGGVISVNAHIWELVLAEF